MTAPPAHGATSLGIPAYFYPWPGSVPWQRMAALPPGSAVVLDPDNGPGGRVDARYTASVAGVRATTDAVLYGYVDTDYALRAVADVASDVERFTRWYGVDGIFLDQVLPMSEQLDYYTEVCGRLREAGLRVALNPGQPRLEPAYRGLADEVVHFEGSGEDYLALGDAHGFAPEPGTVSWHLVYDVADEIRMREVVALARRRGAGRLFVTDGIMPNPWDRLPPYWAELSELLAGSGPASS